MLDALLFGQKYIKKLCEFQEEIIKIIGTEKQAVSLPLFERIEKVKKIFEDKMAEAIK